MHPSAYNIFSPETYDEGVLFWIVVRACKDIVYYPRRRVSHDDYLHAYEWIVDNKPQEVMGVDMTFSDALEALGVNPDNVEILRRAVMRSPHSNRAWKTQIAKDAYTTMDLPDLEPEPWWRIINNLIVNNEPGE